MTRRAVRVLVLAGGALATALAGWGVWKASGHGDAALRPFVRSTPSVPIVFTSRTDLKSLTPAAEPGEEYCYPGKSQWAAAEGRLRLLATSGEVHELTWNKPLPDGQRIQDVMSPSVSPDGRKVVFAGRLAGGHGRFRIFEVGINGKGLRQITGLEDDPGCKAVPPMRWRDKESRDLIPDDERRRVDYDDVDPMCYPDGRIVFASSRVPDLGRGHARRATNLWIRHADGTMEPLTSNRNNDRWPIAMNSGYLLFSMWSRNTEVVTEDKKDIQPFQPGMKSTTLPTDTWIGTVLHMDRFRFGALVKPELPIWRCRPLFNAQVVCMTSPDYPAVNDRVEGIRWRVAQYSVGTNTSAPSSRPATYEQPAFRGGLPVWMPHQDSSGEEWHWATPSPCPKGSVVLAGRHAGRPSSAFGLYLADDNWSSASTTESVGTKLLFDDPAFVDAEPVAVYERPIPPVPNRAGPPDQVVQKGRLQLEGGRYIDTPIGYLASGSIYVSLNKNMPGQETDAGEWPIYHSPENGEIRTLHFYASYRDRFDDPVQPRLRGGWELLLKVKMPGHLDQFDVKLPAGIPFVIAGFDESGRVTRWTTTARDTAGRQGSFYAFAGDHYSAAKVGRYDFCAGCHSGHSNPNIDPRHHAERLP